MKLDANDCLHLTLEIVLEIHAEAIATFGGSTGLRDRALLESAIAAPQASFGGVSPLTDTIDVAAAYLFYLCSNHPFVDGNKRTAWLLVELLIGRSGYWLDIPDDARVDDFVVAVASGSLSFDEIADWFDRRLVRG